MSTTTLESILFQLHFYADQCKSAMLDELAKPGNNPTKVAIMFHTNFYQVKDVKALHSSMHDEYAARCLLYYLANKCKPLTSDTDEKINRDTAEKPFDKLPKNK